MINKDEAYKLISEKVERIVISDDVKAAKEAVIELAGFVNSKEYNKNDPILFQKYQKLIIILEWVSLPLLKKEEVFSLFDNNLEEYLKVEEYIDLKEKIKGFLLGIYSFDERDEIKKEIRNVLNRNKANLTSKKLDQGMDPTVENWIKIYVSSMGNGPVDAISLQQFYVNNKSFKNLNNDEKNKVRKIFDFYEKLKFSSSSVAGIEEVIPVATSDFKGYIADGKLEPIEEKMPNNLSRLYEIVKNTLKNTTKISRHGRQAEIKKDLIRSVESVNNPFIPGPTLSNPLSANDVYDDDKKVSELKKIAETFSVGSLERRAIEQEINSLNK